MEQHGSESYFVIGEGLLGESGGRSQADRCPPAGDRGDHPAVSLLADRAQGHGQAAERDQSQEDRQPDGRGHRRRGSDPRRLHLPRSVHRPRPHLRQDERHARRQGLAGPARPGALAEPRPRLPLRGRPGRPRVGEVLRGRRPSPEDGKDRRRPDGFAALDGFDLPRGAGTDQRRKAHGDHPRSAKRREPRRRPDPLRDDPLPQPGRRHPARSRAAEPAVRHRPGNRHQALPVDDADATTCRGSAPPASSTTSSRTAARRSRSGCQRPGSDDADRVLRRRFRLGHSMVRAVYNWNKVFDDASGSPGALEYLFEFSALGGDLGGETRLPQHLDRRLSPPLRLRRGRTSRASWCQPNKFNRAMRIDTSIVDPLRHLPPSIVAGPDSMPFNDPDRNLAFRNLTRANMVTLATGQQMASFLTGQGRHADEAHERPDSRRPGRRQARRADRRTSARRWSRTPRFGSTSSARRN